MKNLRLDLSLARHIGAAGDALDGSARRGAQVF